jgi:DNA helicase-2/ATP-dependent DNA helicase PcrA
MCASIRKAKGLQADAILAVAETVTELKKWLQTRTSARVKDRQDKCRLGYVAFTRAREMVCIACLEQPDRELDEILQSLGILTASTDRREQPVICRENRNNRSYH